MQYTMLNKGLLLTTVSNKKYTVTKIGTDLREYKTKSEGAVASMSKVILVFSHIQECERSI